MTITTTDSDSKKKPLKETKSAIGLASLVVLLAAVYGATDNAGWAIAAVAACFVFLFAIDEAAEKICAAIEEAGSKKPS